MIKKLFCVVFLSCFCAIIFAQGSFSLLDINTTTSDIRAIVLDSLENDTLVAATVSLYTTKDSALVKTTLTDKKGEFVFKDVKPSLYYLQIRFLGYAPLVVHIPELFFSSSEINLGNLNMRFTTFELDEVVVTAQIPEFIIKGDTIEYNAAAFRVGEGDVLAELLKQMPGLEVSEGGGISTTDGKYVTRIFINDKEYFGINPSMATQNLPAFIVDKVQLIEKRSDRSILTGIWDNERETIINIKVKEGFFDGWLGNVGVAGGELIENPTNESARYLLQSMFSRFNEKSQTVISANTNNINQRSGGASNNAISISGGSSGLTTSSSVGISHNQEINKKIDVKGEVSYNYSDKYSSNKRFSQNFLRTAGSSEIDSTFYVRSASSNRSFSDNYSFSGLATYKDALTTVSLKPSISFNFNRSRSNSEQKTMGGDIDSTMINESNSTDLSNTNGTSIQIQLNVSRKLSDLGRRVSFIGDFNLNRNEGDGTKVAANEFHSGTVENEYIDQASTSKTNNYSYNLTATYVEPFSQKKALNFSYNMRVNNNNGMNNALNYDELTGDYTRRNAKFSRTSELMSVSQNIYVNFSSYGEKYNYNVGLSVSPDYSKNKIFVDDWFGAGLDSLISSVDDRKVVNVTPSINFNYRFVEDRETQKNLQFLYTGSTQHPSVSQLSASDNTNPLNTMMGNPDLVPAFSNDLSLEYRYNNRKKQRKVNLTGKFFFKMNDIINYISYHEGGTMTTTYINQNGNWNALGSVTFATPFRKGFRLNVTSGYLFSHNVGYARVSGRNENNHTILSSEKNNSKTSMIHQMVSLSYNRKWYSGQMNANFFFNNRKNTLDSTSPFNTYNYRISTNSRITLPYKILLTSDINWDVEKGLSSGYNRNAALWDVKISQSLLKGKGTLSFQANDILRKHKSISHSESVYSIQDSESIVLSSFYMLTFSCRFNKFKGTNAAKT